MGTFVPSVGLLVVVGKVEGDVCLYVTLALQSLLITLIALLVLLSDSGGTLSLAAEVFEGTVTDLYIPKKK